MKFTRGHVVIGILLLAILVAVGVLYSKKAQAPTQEPLAYEDETAGYIPRITESSCRVQSSENWNFAEGKLEIAGNTVFVAVADTPQERARGLSECEEVPEGSGMYFVLDEVGVPVFWMKDTLVPLDMVWIREGKVVDITENVQPQPGMADADLARYSPNTEADAVLELPAGQVALLEIERGSEAKIQY